MTNSKDMMRELNFYELDVADLGSDTEDEGGDDAEEREFTKLLMSGGRKEEDESQLSAVEQAVR